MTTVTQPEQEPSDRFKDFPTNDWGEPIIYDTNEIDEITGFLTGDEGEDDSVTVLHNLVRYLNVVHPGKTMTQVLIETEEAALATQPEQEPVAYRCRVNGHWSYKPHDVSGLVCEPLYTTPPQPKVRTGDCLLTGVCASEGHKIQKAQSEEQEPVAYLYHDASNLEELLEAERKCLNMHSVLISIRRHEAYRNETPLYTTPPQRTWVGLTDEDKKEYVAQDFGGNRLDAIDWAAKRLQEKNT